MNFILMFLGLGLLILGAEFLVRGTANIAKKFHIPEILIGLTIVSIGTSMPELIITVRSAMQNSSDLIVGNSIGSDLCNLLLILGIMAIIRPIKLQKETRIFHIPMALLSTLLIFAFAVGVFPGESGVIGFYQGFILVTLFVIYLIYPILLDRKTIIEEYKKEKEKNKKKQKSTITQIILIILGIILLKVGGDLVVDNATTIAKNFGVSERIIGLTIVAIGTALPELVTSIVATINNDADIGVGNLIGSSVLNSFLILGLGSLINPIRISGEFIVNLMLLSSTTVLIWLFCYIPKKNTLTRTKGIILVALFAIYMVRLFI